MSHRSTSPNNPPGWFATTRWSVVIRAGDGGDSTRALEELCHAYWRPLFEFARRSGATPADAEDLTQGFFALILRSGAVARADRDRGRFRSYLLGAFRNFIFESHRKNSAAKRGGGAQVRSLNDLPCDPCASNSPPDHEFDRAWAFALLERVFDRLAAEYESAGRGDLFNAFRPQLSGAGNQGYDAIGTTLGMSGGAVGVAIHRMRKRYGALLRAAVADTVADAEEVDDELRYLIHIVSESPGSVTFG